MAENGINLLPEDLRKAESRERKRPVTPPPAPRFSEPVSEFEERLRGLAAVGPERSLWQKMKDWFTTVPPPPGTGEAPPPPPPSRPTPPVTPVVRGQSKAPSMPAAPPFTPTVVSRPAPKSTPEPLAAAADTAGRGSRGGARSAPPIPLGMLLDVNLLPSESLMPGWRPTMRLAAVAGAGVLIIGITYAVVSSLVAQRTNQLASAQNTARDLAQQAKQLTGQLNEVQTAGDKMDTISQLLTSRPDWGKFLTALETLTLPSITYSNLAVSGSEATLNAQGPTIKELARQLLVLQQSGDIVAKVVMGPISSGEARGNEPGLVRTTFQLDLVSSWLAAATPAQQ